MPPASAGLTAHAEAVAGFVSRAAALPEDRWTEPPAPGKWSPAEIAEHLTLTYAGLCGELSGGPSIRVRVKGFKLLMIRLVFMPKLLRSGVFPAGVRSPRELLPAVAQSNREAALSRLAERATTFEGLIAPRLGRKDGGITHPFFARLTPAQSLRFAEIHTRHHAGQLGGRE